MDGLNQVDGEHLMNFIEGNLGILPASYTTQAVFFDLGFTLIHFQGDYPSVLLDSYYSLARALKREGYLFEVDEFVRRFKNALADYHQSRDIDLIERPVETYLTRVLNTFGHIEPPESVTRNALAEMYQTTEAYWQLMPDTLATLRQLQRTGYRLGLISNAANADNVNRLIDRCGLRGFFEVLLISAVEKIRKPDRRIYARALNLLHLTPDRAVMVGDTLTADIIGAQNAGLRAAWVTSRASHPENLRARPHVNPDAVIDQLSELPYALQQFH